MEPLFTDPLTVMTAPKPTLSTATAEELEQARNYAHWLKEFQLRRKQRCLLPRKCKHCETEFTPKRDDKVFCTDRCRSNFAAKEFAGRYKRMEKELEELHAQYSEIFKENQDLKAEVARLRSS